MLKIIVTLVKNNPAKDTLFLTTSKICDLDKI